MLFFSVALFHFQPEKGTFFLLWLTSNCGLWTWSTNLTYM